MGVLLILLPGRATLKGLPLMLLPFLPVTGLLLTLFTGLLLLPLLTGLLLILMLLRETGGLLSTLGLLTLCLGLALGLLVKLLLGLILTLLLVVLLGLMPRLLLINF